MKPRHVATYVRSDTHNWFGRVAVKCKADLNEVKKAMRKIRRAIARG